MNVAMEPKRLAILLCGGLSLAVLVLCLKNSARTQLSIASQVTASHDAAASRVSVFVFLSTGCPISNGYIPELNRLATRFQDDNLSFLGVVPGSHVTADDVARHQSEFGIRFPVLHDPNGHLVRQYKASHTPQAIVVASGRVVYSGRIDNRYVDLGKRRADVTQHDLQDVLVRLANHQTDAPKRTEPIGCLIEAGSNVSHRIESDTPTFTTDIVPILFQHCSRCHRRGEVAPFSLLTYEDTVAHASQIRVVVNRRLMPPWKAEPGFGRFRNEHRLSSQQINLIDTWVASGMARGDETRTPPPPQFTSGWQLGSPDLELIMLEPFDVPADGPDIYQHFVIPTGLTENRLVSAVEFRPGASEVVHHAFVYYDTTGTGRELDKQDPGPGYSRVGTPGFPVTGSFGGWGPGGLPRRLPRELGMPLHANADLVVQIHYHPSGRAVTDRSRIGLHFAPPTATYLVREIMVANVDLAIPAGECRHHHSASYTLPVETIVLDATPHMHTLGREIKVEAFLPDGKKRPLVWIRDWDFNWQENYVFKEPIGLPAGTRIQLDCWYDNSRENPLNPNSPPQKVRWGDFSNDEMGICYFQVTTQTMEDYETLARHSVKYFDRLWQRDQANRKQPLAERSEESNP